MAHHSVGQSLAENKAWRTTGFLAVATLVVLFNFFAVVLNAIGAERFALAIGLPGRAGAFVGVSFVLAAAATPHMTLKLWRSRNRLLSIAFSTVWMLVVGLNLLTSHSTVSLAVANIERSLSQQAEGRHHAVDVHDRIRHQLKKLEPPRGPSLSIEERIRREQVPAAIWKSSAECTSIAGDAYLQKACRHVVELREQLAAAKHYEALQAQEETLRQQLEKAPITASRDPLPATFEALVGGVAAVDGATGIGLLFTVIVELIATLGPIALFRIWEHSGQDAPVPPRPRRGRRKNKKDDVKLTSKDAPQNEAASPPFVSRAPQDRHREDHRAKPREALGTKSAPSAPAAAPQVAFEPSPPSRVSGGVLGSVGIFKSRPTGATLLAAQTKAQGHGEPKDPAHERAIGDSLTPLVRGREVWSAAIWSSYRANCAQRGLQPMSRCALGRQLTDLGLIRRKSNGRIIYAMPDRMPGHAPSKRAGLGMQLALEWH